MKVKVCGMTDFENVKAIVDYKPDFLGFIFYEESSRNITETEVLQIETGSTKKVGVFVNENIGEVRKLAATYQLEYIQLHGDESPEFCNELRTPQVNVIKAFSIDDHFSFDSLEDYSSAVDYFLFDTKGIKRGGNGVKFNWNVLDKYTLDTPFFLSGGITTEDADDIQKLNHPKLYAVDINSGFEISPGIKDAKAVGEFIDQLNKPSSSAVITKEERMK